MTRIMLAALLTAATVSPASAAERRYTLTDFDRVQVEGPFEVALTTGRASSAKASGSSAAIERVALDVQGRTLRIRANRSSWGGYPGDAAGPVRIELSTHELRGASLAGSGRLAIDKIRAMRVDLAVSGSGAMEIGSVEADALVIGLLGAGKIGLGGKAKSMVATVQGSGDLHAERLTVEDLRINAETAGSISVAAGRAATVTSAGQGNVRVLGSPACTVKQLGSGQVFCGKSNQR